ncbi:epsin-2-like [Oryza brachyantha]|uniref:ENTH domain-containing protein n=1 Tax=Oryza brachyantha TaxID=4533 RepID=J3L5P5_ORYBR|nr:epsin-2-like [Oryza brachyantha]
MDATSPFSFHELRRQASSYLTDKIRSARLALTDVTPTQLMTEEATSGDASPPNVKTMSLIARQAFEIDEYVRIADILHKRFARFDRRQWREAYKALLLLEHLLTHGPRSVASEFQRDREVIQQMVTFQHIDEKGFNWGMTVKSKSERVLKLLERGPFLEEERERARKIAREIKGFGSFNLSSAQASGQAAAARASMGQCYGRSNSRFEDRWRREDCVDDGDKENLVASTPEPDQAEELHRRHPFHSFAQQPPEAMLLLSQ